MTADTRARVGIATCEAAPALDHDAPLLTQAFDDLGVAYETQVWDDPAVDWSCYESVLVRSTWDYPQKYSAFLRWIDTCRRLVNPADVLKWNTEKTYLNDLATAGVPVVPTQFVPPGGTATAQWADVVIKPTVSGSAAHTGRFQSTMAPSALSLISLIHAQDCTAMIQPYLAGIDEEGETSMVYLGGRFSHAMRREPLLSGSGVRRPVVVADVLATVRPVEPTAEQRSVADAALAAVPGGAGQLAYARVDVIPGSDGPVLLELEATDCFLFLGFADAAARHRLVASLMHEAS